MQDHTLNLLRSIGKDLLDLVLTVSEVAVMAVITYYVARFAGSFAARALKERRAGQDGALLVGRLTSIGIWIVGFSWILTSLGVNSTGLLAFLSASTVAISLSLQDIIRNFVAGIILLIERPFRVGDRIRVRDISGEVQGIDVRTTHIRNTEGALVHIPNATIYTEVLVNRSHYRTRRLEVVITYPKSAYADAAATIAAALTGVTGVRHPIPTPTLRSATADEMVIELSLLIDSSADTQERVTRQLFDAFPDATLEVTKVS